MTPTLVLLPSPLLGPALWGPVAQELAGRGQPVAIVPPAAGARAPSDVLDAWLAALPTDDDLVLVPHSNAGAYVPELVSRLSVVGAVFVDAVLPPPHGELRLAPPALLPHLRELAGADGLLPVWTQWWDEAEVAGLFPDAATRDRVEQEQQRLPLTYFEQVLDVPAGWDALPACYLAFGDTYAGERADAAGRGWSTRTLAGHHLHPLTEPAQVAGAVLDLLRDDPAAEA